MRVKLITQENPNEFHNLLPKGLKEIIKTNPQQTKQWIIPITLLMLSKKTAHTK